MVAEKRALYNAMRQALEGFHAIYEQMQITVKDCVRALFTCAEELSRWLGNPYPSLPVSEVVAVTGFHAWMIDHASVMSADIDQASNLVNILLNRDAPTEAQRRFDLTSPMPMVIILCLQLTVFCLWV